jgi:membrane associated rhomboid family serine protease
VSTHGAPDPSGGVPVCYRHADRPTGLRCSRCERPACPECLHEASVGYQCQECVRAGSKQVRRPTTIAGARPNAAPVVVYVLIALNVLVYLITAIQSHAVNPDANVSRIYELGAEWPPAVAGGAWWQLITAGFLHESPLHIGLNMISLYVIGRDVERILGRVRFTALYLVSLFGGGVSVLLFAPNSATVGASGAVFGLMGGVLVILVRLRANLTQVIVVIVVNLVISVTIPNISLTGHLGGLVIGALLTAALVYAPSPRRTLWQAGAVLVAVVVLRDFRP